jgi:hypothetical protein
MGKNRPPSPPTPNNASSQEAPKDFPQVQPQDLYATSDIRFVMLEIGKLTTKVDRLIEDVKDQGIKISTLNSQATFLKGWIAAAVVIIGVVVWVASSILDHKWDSIITALDALPKQTPKTH